jgi:hypothetical protein
MEGGRFVDDPRSRAGAADEAAALQGDRSRSRATLRSPLRDAPSIDTWRASYGATGVTRFTA